MGRAAATLDVGGRLERYRTSSCARSWPGRAGIRLGLASIVLATGVAGGVVPSSHAASAIDASLPPGAPRPATETEWVGRETTQSVSREARRRILEIAERPGREASDRALDVATTAIASRRRLLGDVLDARMAPLLDQQDRNVATARAVLDALDARPLDPVALGVAIAKLGTEWQARTMGWDLGAVRLPRARHASPSEAALALAEGARPSAETLADIRTLDDLPQPTRGALAGVIDAFATMQRASRAAFEAADRDELERIRDLLASSGEDPDGASFAGLIGASPAETFADLGLNLAPVLVARNELLDAIAALQDGIETAPPPPTRAATAPISFAPYFAIDPDLADDNTYDQDYYLIIDVGGSDHYDNSAGGSSSLTLAPTTNPGYAGALIDLLGVDVYDSGRSSGINGGGILGTGFLYDGLGNDRYVAGSNGVNGGGNVGVGFLLDTLGSDVYSGSFSGVNGGGAAGMGMLVDVLGSTDTYMAGNSGTNGGGVLGGVGFLSDVVSGTETPSAGSLGTNGGGELAGVGFLLHEGGDGGYVGGNDGTNGGGSVGGVGFLMDVLGGGTYQAGSGGTNGGGGDADAFVLVPTGGVGMLIDAQDTSTTDTYSAGVQGVNGGGYFGGAGNLIGVGGRDRYISVGNGTNGGGSVGAGLLVDLDGNDDYIATAQFGTNGGGAVGNGFLLDAEGRDLYDGHDGGSNGGGSLGVGYLYDAGGNDTYTGGARGINGGGSLGTGELVDAGGNDTYSAGMIGVNGGGELGTGLLLDGGGHDVYTDGETGSVANRSMVPKGQVGARVDGPPSRPPGVPTLVSPAAGATFGFLAAQSFRIEALDPDDHQYFGIVEVRNSAGVVVSEFTTSLAESGSNQGSSGSPPVPIPPGANYTWTARAIDETGALGAPSAARVLHVAGPPPNTTVTPTVVSPAPGKDYALGEPQLVTLRATDPQADPYVGVLTVTDLAAPTLVYTFATAPTLSGQDSTGAMALPPGSYGLRARIVDARGAESGQTLSVSFTVGARVGFSSDGCDGAAPTLQGYAGDAFLKVRVQQGADTRACARADGAGVGEGAMVRVAPASPAPATAHRDQPGAHPGAVAPPDAGLPSSLCQVSGGARHANTDAGGSHVWLYSFQQPEQAHLCARVQGTQSLGGRLTVDLAGAGGPVQVETIDMSPCTQMPVSQGPVQIGHSPLGQTPFSVCVIAAGQGVRLSFDPGAGPPAPLVWTPDPGTPGP